MTLQNLSPPEAKIALVYIVNEAIKKGASNEILIQWRKIILTMGAQFEVHLPGEDRYWRAHVLRQIAIEKGEVSHLGVRSWIVDVSGFKDHQVGGQDNRM